MQFLDSTQPQQSHFIGIQPTLFDGLLPAPTPKFKPTKTPKFKQNTPNSQQKFTQTRLTQSPLNYTGGKFRLLPQILPLFPKNAPLMLDLFCGGASVGINANAQKVILNDKSSELVGILRLFQRTPLNELLQGLSRLIAEFKLSNSREFGYAHYDCNGAVGLSAHNKAGFNALRAAYNADKDPLKLFALVIYGFNNQLRFNARGEFNLPCGKRDFNAKMQDKFTAFVRALQSREISLENVDFRDFDTSILNKQSFVYIDPPYLLATASYNENGAWGEQDERDLYEFMQALHAKGVKFAFSNVLFHKGKPHSMLEKWLEKCPFLRTHFLNFSYKNCNYHTKRSESNEVLITNY